MTCRFRPVLPDPPKIEPVEPAEPASEPLAIREKWRHLDSFSELFFCSARLGYPKGSRFLRVLVPIYRTIASLEKHEIAQKCMNSHASKTKKELTIQEQTNSATSPLIKPNTCGRIMNNCIHHWEGHFLTSAVLRHVYFRLNPTNISRLTKNGQQSYRTKYRTTNQETRQPFVWYCDVSLMLRMH